MGVAGLVMIVSFAGLLTAHMSVTVGLLRRPPRWRAWLGLVPPLAPWVIYWALQERLYVRCGLWVVNLLGYLVALAFANP